jgi:hypothetical protein
MQAEVHRGRGPLERSGGHSVSPPCRGGAEHSRGYHDDPDDGHCHKPVPLFFYVYVTEKGNMRKQLLYNFTKNVIVVLNMSNNTRFLQISVDK